MVALALKPAAGVIRVLLVFVTLAVLNLANTARPPIILLTEQETEEGKELTGTMGDFDWRAIITETQKSGGKVKKVELKIKYGDVEQSFRIDYDTRTKDRTLRSLVDYIMKRR